MLTRIKTRRNLYFCKRQRILAKDVIFLWYELLPIKYHNWKILNSIVCRVSPELNQKKQQQHPVSSEVCFAKNINITYLVLDFPLEQPTKHVTPTGQQFLIHFLTLNMSEYLKFNGNERFSSVHLALIKF